MWLYAIWWCWSINKFLRNLRKKKEMVVHQKTIRKNSSKKYRAKCLRNIPIFFFYKLPFLKLYDSFTKMRATQQKGLRFQIFSMHLCQIWHSNVIYKLWKYITETVIRSALKRGSLKIFAKSFKIIYQGFFFYKAVGLWRIY